MRVTGWSSEKEETECPISYASVQRLLEELRRTSFRTSSLFVRAGDVALVVVRSLAGLLPPMSLLYLPHGQTHSSEYVGKVELASGLLGVPKPRSKAGGMQSAVAQVHR